MASETRHGRHSCTPVGALKLAVLAIAGLLLWRGDTTGLVLGDVGSAGSACYTLTLNVGSGSGTVLAMPDSSGPCPSGQYAPGFTVGVLATAGAGYQWSSWSGTDDDSTSSTNVTMTGDRTATAYFTSNCYQLTLTVGGGNGSVVAMPASAGGCPAGQYPLGFTVGVVATAGAGYQWSSWSGTDDDSTSSTNVTMTGDRTATAYFTSNCYRLTLTVGGGNGSVVAMPASAGDCPAGQYPLGFTVGVVATAGAGYQWSSWSGTDDDSRASTNVTMTSDRAAMAYFTSNCYRLTLTVGGGNGSVMAMPVNSGSCPPGQYTGGFAVAVFATAAPGYQWSSWSGTDNDSINSTNVTMTGDRTATAYFVLQGGTAPPTQVPTTTPTSTATPPDPGTPAPSPTFTPVPPGLGLRGDANCDGNVTPVDAALVLQAGAGLIALLPCPQQADANGDGHVSAVDAAVILQFVAGLLSAF